MKHYFWRSTPQYRIINITNSAPQCRLGKYILRVLHHSVDYIQYGTTVYHSTISTRNEKRKLSDFETAKQKIHKKYISKRNEKRNISDF